MEKTDNELIAQYLTYGDQSAFNVLVSRYQSSIRNFLRRLTGGNHAMADDIAQETFIKMFSNLKSFRGDSKLSTWLHKIAYHSFLRHQEGENNMSMEGEEHLVMFSVDDYGPTDVELENLMQHLSIYERLMLTLSYAVGMSHSEISEVTGAPLGTIKSHINRGKKKLEALLNEEDKFQA